MHAGTDPRLPRTISEANSSNGTIRQCLYSQFTKTTSFSKGLHSFVKRFSRSRRNTIALLYLHTATPNVKPPRAEWRRPSAQGLGSRSSLIRVWRATTTMQHIRGTIRVSSLWRLFVVPKLFLATNVNSRSQSKSTPNLKARDSIIWT